MTITPEQREARRAWVGASDVAAICGLDEYRTAHDVWLEKVYGTEDKKSDAAQDGDDMEPFLVGWAGDKLGWKPWTGIRFDHPELPMAAHPDGVGYAPERYVVEAKTAGWHRPGFWPEDAGWTDDSPPDRVVLQVHAQMMCVGDLCNVGYVPALVSGLGLKLYTVERNDDWCDAIARRVADFWKLVQSCTPPKEQPTLDVAKRVIRTPGKTVPVPEDLAASYTAAKFAAKQHRQREDEAKARLLAALGDAEAGEYDDGVDRYLITNFADKRGARRLNIKKIGDVL